MLPNTSLLQVGVVPEIGELASILGCKVESPDFSASHLVLPLGASFKTQNVFGFPYKEIQKRFGREEDVISIERREAYTH